MPYKIPKASEYFSEYKQFQNEYFKKLSFVAITFTKLEKIERKKCQQTAQNVFRVLWYKWN